MFNFFLEIALLFMGREEVKTMAIIYATLIVKGVKTFAEVPARIKDQVRDVLINIDCADLATDGSNKE